MDKKLEKELEEPVENSQQDSKSIDYIEDNALCSICHDKSVPCVTIIWKGYVTSTQIRFIHEKILEVIRRYGLRKILGDDSALPTIHAEDQEWIIKDWVPRAVAAGLKAGAAKRSASYFGKLSTNNIQSAVLGDMKILFFDDFEKARQWLRNFKIPI